ncbi:hypothetical protein [Clostridium thermarum]|uniref:hypothetical protein n=1 Tax=Clostridium thermarum TaxID=1716543 RepID=UPI00111E2178|nr:hypothetical protein [Clostridium thermarum]
MKSRYVMLIINSSLIILLIVITIIFYNKTRFLENRIANLSSQLNYKDNEIKELNNNIQSKNTTLLQASNVLKIYDSLIIDIYDNINAPIYVYDSDTKDVFDKFNSYINNSIDTKNELIFKVGPVKKDTDDTYFIEYIMYSKLALDENLSQIIWDTPPPLLTHHVLKYHNGKIESIN